MRRHFLSLFLILALVSCAVAQNARSLQSAPSVERLRGHVSQLASDKMEGRKTGSPGAQLAASYIAGEFARYNLKRSIGQDLPGMSVIEADSPRRYMQEFPFVAGVELGKNNSMIFVPGAQASQDKTAAPPTATRAAPALDMQLGEDWMLLGFSSNTSLSNLPATFVGYGIKADELNYNNYAGAQLANRVAVALGGSPDGDNPHGQFTRYADVRWKAIAARNAGAAALVIIAREENFKDERLSRLSYDHSMGDAGLPVVVVSRQAAARFFGFSSPIQLGEFEKKLQGLHNPPASPSTDQNDVKIKVAQPLDFSLSLSTEVVRRNVPAYNVVGILEGSDPVLKNEAIIIGAHYDHLGRGGSGSGSLAAREGDIHHGADDNASGVAGVIELARIFSAERAKQKRTLIFIAFGGEEEGLLGSNYYVNHPIWPLAQTVAMINMDMIGRMTEKRLMIGGVGTASEWREMIAAANLVRSLNVNAAGSAAGTRADGETVAQTKGAPVVVAANGQTVVSFDPTKQFALTLNEDGYGPSDHSSFYAKQIPVLFFFTGTHMDYHKPSDTAEKINYEDEARLLSFVADLVRAIDNGAKRPTYTTARSQAQGRTTGFRVYLGTIPTYAESSDGLRLDGVREDSPAAKAGLKAGDRIIRMAGREIRNVYDYTAALGEMKAGEEYEVEVVREGQTLKLKLTPAARK